jgi:hypothetical protein
MKQNEIINIVFFGDRLKKLYFESIEISRLIHKAKSFNRLDSLRLTNDIDQLRKKLFKEYENELEQYFKNPTNIFFGKNELNSK